LSVLDRATQENFKVASRLLPRDARRHLMAFYGYARLVDEIGDAYARDRLAALDWVGGQLDRAFLSDRDAAVHPLVAAAARSAQETGAGDAPFRRLIDANRQDQHMTEYATFDDLLAYCALSANPIGELVLAAFGRRTNETLPLSDRICTGLQLAEHAQDVVEDARHGRVYLPAEDMRRFGVTREELARGAGSSPALRSLMAFEVARTRRVLMEGAPLVGMLQGRPRWAVAGFLAGGLATLDAIAAQRFDPHAGVARPGRAKTLALTMKGALG
jgi:squalene synthase HpnC